MTYYVTKREKCPECGGTGSIVSSEKAYPIPHGSDASQFGPALAYVCQFCHGTGEIVTEVLLREALMALEGETK